MKVIEAEARDFMAALRVRREEAEGRVQERRQSVHQKYLPYRVNCMNNDYIRHVLCIKDRPPNHPRPTSAPPAPLNKVRPRPLRRKQVANFELERACSCPGRATLSKRSRPLWPCNRVQKERSNS
jgi:hypothetical protein